MVAGGSISATQIYYPQNIVAWGEIDFFIFYLIIGKISLTFALSYSSHDYWTCYYDSHSLRYLKKYLVSFVSTGSPTSIATC